MISLTQYSQNRIVKEAIKLSEEEAFKLAEELKAQLQSNQFPEMGKAKIQLIIAGLGDQRGLLRRTFTESLGKVGPSATPLLKDALLYHSNVTVRRAAAKALRLVGDQDALPALLHALINDKDPVVQGSSVGAMAALGPKALDHLFKVLINPKNNAMQCGLASWGISMIGAEAPDAIRRAAQSSNELIRASAISTLGEQIQYDKNEEAKQLVIEALEDKAIEVRIEATVLLGKFPDEIWAYQLLIKRLTDSNEEIRKKAAISLMQIKAFKSIDSIERCIQEENDKSVRKILQLALFQLRKSEEVHQARN